jgi:membrane-associated phospholipid phosphatase
VGKRRVRGLFKSALVWGLIICGLYILLAILVDRRVFAGIDLAVNRFLQQIIPHSFELPSFYLDLLGSIVATSLIFASMVFFSSRGIRVRLILIYLFLMLLELQGKTMIRQSDRSDQLSIDAFISGTPPDNLNTRFSFPSGHAARTCFLVTLAIMLLSRSKIRSSSKCILIVIAIAAAAAMLITRVYSDHWTTDVIGGALIGLALALFAFPGAVTSEDPPRRRI